MLNITRRGDMLILSADPPERVRFRHPNGQFFPDRAGRMVGAGQDAWHIELQDGVQLRFQRQVGTDWVDASGGG